MPVLFTSRQRVKDWDQYQAATERWKKIAEEHGCTRFQIYWRGGDPDEVLWLTEWPNHKIVDEVGELIGEEINSLLENPDTEDILWTLSDAAHIP